MAIKTFEQKSDAFVNEFVKQTRGKIVCYTPNIIVEYDDTKTSYTDPYEGTHMLEANLVITFSTLDNINDQGQFNFIDKFRVHRREVDAIAFSTLNRDEMKFYKDGELVHHHIPKTGYVEVNIKYYEKILSTHRNVDGGGSVEFGFAMYEGSIWYDHFDLYAYLVDAGCRVLNLTI